MKEEVIRRNAKAPILFWKRTNKMERKALGLVNSFFFCSIFAAFTFSFPTQGNAEQLAQGHWTNHCPLWMQKKHDISTHMNLSGHPKIPKGLPLNTPIYRVQDGTWFKMRLGYYKDFLFETMPRSPGRSRRDLPSYFAEAEASKSKINLKKFILDAIAAKKIDKLVRLPWGAYGLKGSSHEFDPNTYPTSGRERTKVHLLNNFSFWYPSGRYVERVSNLAHSFPCESGRLTQPEDASGEYAILFTIRQAFYPFGEKSNYQLLISRIQKWFEHDSFPSPSNDFPFSKVIDPTAPYRIYHADENFVARFNCQRILASSTAIPPSCDGIVFWPEEGLAVSMRFPSLKGVIGGNPVYLEPIEATYEIIQKWRRDAN